jgi:hypothetical protein
MKLRHRGRVHNDPELCREIMAEFGPGTEGGRELRAGLSDVIGEDLLTALESQARVEKPRRARKAGRR